MFPTLSSGQQSNQSSSIAADQTYMTNKAAQIKGVAKSASEQVKAQAEHIYQAYSVKNWFHVELHSNTVSIIATKIKTNLNATHTTIT